MIIDIPGAFHTFLDGTGAVAGDLYSNDPDEERGAQELRAAYLGSTKIKRGKGYALRLDLPSVDAAVVLAEYAETCIHSNFGGDKEWSEINAARTVLERVQQATEGRVAYNGFYVTLDGQKT